MNKGLDFSQATSKLEGEHWSRIEHIVFDVVAESPVSLRWSGWKEGVQAEASLPREDRRKTGSPGTPPPRRGAATNPQV